MSESVLCDQHKPDCDLWVPFASTWLFHSVTQMNAIYLEQKLFQLIVFPMADLLCVFSIDLYKEGFGLCVPQWEQMEQWEKTI